MDPVDEDIILVSEIFKQLIEFNLNDYASMDTPELMEEADPFQ